MINTESNREIKLESALQLIHNIAYDYDGCNTIQSLKGLIDELDNIAIKSLCE